MTFSEDLGQADSKSTMKTDAAAVLGKSLSVLATGIKRLVAKDEFTVALETPWLRFPTMI